MREFLVVLFYLLDVAKYLLLARVVVEMVASFSRNWSPRGVVAVVFEWLFTVTDPPVKLLRRLIPPVRIGAVSLDLSVLVLFLAIFVGQMVVGTLIGSL